MEGNREKGSGKEWNNFFDGILGAICGKKKKKILMQTTLLFLAHNSYNTCSHTHLQYIHTLTLIPTFDKSVCKSFHC